MKKIILDTNFLLIPAQFKVDIFSEIYRLCHFQYKLCMLDKTVDELHKIMREQRGKDKVAAKLALAIAKAKKIDVITTETNRKVDDIIVEIAEKEDVAVATQDKLLKSRLKDKAGIITLRKQQHLILQ